MPKTTKKTMAKAKGTLALVNKAIERKLKQRIETRSGINGGGEFLFQDAIRANNLMYFLNQGDALANYAGRAINLKNIHIKGRVFIENDNNQPNGTCVRLLVVRAKTPWTNTSTTLSTGDLFRIGGQPHFASSGHIDFSKVELLYDKKWVVQPFHQSGNANGYISYDIKVPFNMKKVYFDNDNSGYLKHGNYYFVQVVDQINAAASIDRVALNNFTWTVNFQDA